MYLPERRKILHIYITISMYKYDKKTSINNKQSKYMLDEVKLQQVISLKQ